ncbi:zinc-binding dehydrogenase [Afipia sp. GAS231]|uniref:zinc-dependent alcohol dehydrogenase n=1 Tax=Afipia sp. GAS231 TaxID=1882747 RepID=UPI0008799302|nr:alcohol dehydrogenase catalytic domain-containing protein [Afipia sp. GAS231]SDO13744.1 alcohol dehydrogenase [Afipia sp. GAS231]
MRQLTYVGGSTIEWWDVPEPKLQDDRDALVRPLAVTRCDLDLTIVGGKAGLPGPFALGHETAGVVTDIGGAVTNFVPGDLVIVPFQISCGECERCRRGHTNACTSVPFRSSYGLKPVCGVEYGGALSDLIRVPFADHMLVRQPAGHALSQTAALADGATDAFSAVAHWLRQRPGVEVLVIGGFGQSLSMFSVQAALGCGARRVVYVDDDTKRLAKAKSLGAEVHEGPKGLVMDPIGLFPIVMDAAATDASILLAIRSTEPNGVCQRMYGDFKEITPVPLRHMYGVGVTLRISRVNVRAEMPACVDQVVCGHFHPEHVITRKIRFEDAHEAIGDPTIRVAFVRDGVE